MSAGDERSARMLEKVRALLAKAESTTFEEEAEAYTAKAQELMARHAIDEALLDRNAGPAGVEALRVPVDDPYARAKASLLSAVANENRCRTVWAGQHRRATVFGAAPDLRATEMLYTSLLVQAAAAMQRAGSRADAGGRSRTRSFRHAFLLAFAGRIAERLRSANEAAVDAAAGQVGDAFLPVLAARAEAAERARDEAFPKLVRARTSLSNVEGYRAGRAAADSASLDRSATLPA